MKNYKIVISMLLSFSFVFMVACGSNKKVADIEPLTENVSDSAEKPEDVAVPDNTDSLDVDQVKVTLPAYEYPGPELFYTVIYRYIIDEFGAYYEQADVGIPCPLIVDVDEDNREDIRVYGDFSYYNYNLNGNTLETVSGGSYPGCMHIKTTDEGYEVTSVDLVEDGSGYDASAKKIFGDEYDDFLEATSNDTVKETIRAQIIANYVAANNLSITEYKDYGWDPISLPEENIDSFYSKLD